MRLRHILLVLSLLAFMSVSAGGYLYYSSVRDSAFKEARRQAVSRLEMIAKHLSALLSENARPVQALAGMNEMREALVHPDDTGALARANAVLDHFRQSFEVDVCYLMDPRGVTIASSNRDDPDSFVGQNFAFRPYFTRATRSAPVNYLALGTTSGKRGVYHSYPVIDPESGRSVGLAVIKGSIEQVERELKLFEEEIVWLVDPQGVIFIAKPRDYLYHTLWELNEEEQRRIVESRQFGSGPLPWAGFQVGEKQIAHDRRGEAYQIYQTPIESYDGWKVMHLQSVRAIARSVSAPLIKFTGPVVLALIIFIGIGVLMLYRKASHEIHMRRSAESALQESEKRYRSLYLNTPAMLHSIDAQGHLVSVSDYWAEALGYHREEVIGKRLTDFFTEASRHYAEKVVFPEFFKNGFCKDIPYQFVRKDGKTTDVLLSAIVDRDRSGRMVRTLAVSVDVTERNRAEAALTKAKEALSRYSRDLERQVRHRTQEITSIITHTPAVVYMKNRDGRFTLVNSRYEKLFGVNNRDIAGKADNAVLSTRIAGNIHDNDQRVLSENRSIQVEEVIPQSDGDHTYLSVKFPVYDENGRISGVCGISTDITEVKTAQLQLRRLSAGIMAGQEKERAALARELHDELGQVLTALRMDSVWLHQHLSETAPQAADRALTMCSLIDMTIKEVRSMAFRLRPGVLDHLGLVDALEWFTTDFERRTGISCLFEHPTVPPISEAVATAAYRITQEALTNVARHSGASRVDVALQTREGGLMLAVKDDGCGFDVSDLAATEGLGIAGMRERAVLAGGRLNVLSQPGGGTRVELQVPI